MKIASLHKDVTFNEKKPSISVLLETEYAKEIRIAMKNGQLMKEHQTPFPIAVEIFEGAISFTVRQETYLLQKGDIISLEGGVPHSLFAKEDRIVVFNILS